MKYIDTNPGGFNGGRHFVFIG